MFLFVHNLIPLVDIVGDLVACSVSGFEINVPLGFCLLHWSVSNTRKRRQAGSATSAIDACVHKDAFQCGANVRSRAPPAPEGAPPQSKQEWPDHHRLPRRRWKAHREATTSYSAREVELMSQHDEFDASRSWSARERVPIRGMEDDLGKVRTSWWRLRSWRPTCMARLTWQV